MYRQAHGVYWANEYYRTPREPRENEFWREALALGAKVCLADGDVGREELAAFRHHFGVNGANYPEATAVFNAALSSSEDPVSIARRLKAKVTGDRSLLEHVLVGLAMTAAADGRYDAAEHAVLAAIAAEFEFGPAELEGIVARTGVFARSRKHGDDDRTKPEAEEAPHLAVLGLKVGARVAEIRTAYLRLVRQYHPDRLAAAGLPRAEIKRREELLKTVNNAY
jgi:DnaJ like chaperone protein